VGQKIYDAHYIVGDEFLTDTYTSANVLIDPPGDNWLEVSPDKLYTNNAVKTFTSATAKRLYLHLDEYIPTAPNPAIRKGSIDLVTASGVVKKIYIQQLPALPLGTFGVDTMPNTVDEGVIYNRTLYMEQRYEFHTMPKYTTSATTPSPNNIYNGLGMACVIYDAANYGTVANPTNPFNWQATTFEAINYCAYKNRPAAKTSTGALSADDIKWYLPSQAQLMAMWVSFESYRNASYSNFKGDQNFNETSNNLAYWSSTDNQLYSNEAQYVNFIFGNVGHYNRANQSWARCVRNGGITSHKLISEVMPTDIIINFSSLPENSHILTDLGGYGDEKSSQNAKILSVLRLKSYSPVEMTWEDAKAFCASQSQTESQRLPTQRELQAIWTVKSEITKYSFEDDYYWTATGSSTHTNNAYAVYMGSHPAGDAGNTPHLPKTNKARVRCVCGI
jgi:hypothetical protein